MLKIKLSPLGKKHEPHYRIVVMEENSKLTSDNLVILGDYHPLANKLTFDQDAVSEWIKKGAQPTPKVKRLLKI